MKRIVLAIAAPVLLLGGCDRQTPADEGSPAAATQDGTTPSQFDPQDCAGFTAADAEAVLGVPAGEWTRTVEKIGDSLWSCTFDAKKASKVLVFSIEVAPSAQAAADQMEQYRSHLNDNYSDLMGLGDEGVWTEVNHTVTYRAGKVTIQVQQPADKMQQLGVIKAIFGRNPG